MNDMWFLICGILIIFIFAAGYKYGRETEMENNDMVQLTSLLVNRMKKINTHTQDYSKNSATAHAIVNRRKVLFASPNNSSNNNNDINNGKEGEEASTSNTIDSSKDSQKSINEEVSSDNTNISSNKTISQNYDLNIFNRALSTLNINDLIQLYVAIRLAENNYI